jgi:hypothetical protein
MKSKESPDAGKTLPMQMKDCPELETIFLSKQRGHGAGNICFNF